jgi:transketolase
MSAADLLAVPLAGQHFTSNGRSQATVVAAGITLHEAATLRQAARDTDGRLVVVEDHWPESGL